MANWIVVGSPENFEIAKARGFDMFGFKSTRRREALWPPAEVIGSGRAYPSISVDNTRGAPSCLSIRKGRPGDGCVAWEPN